ncbi:Protein of unknown function [Pyronema omphalodes CBS 100304]|uniref:Uncharacterized protein n=1 Tax=Pyronema omphalodes (strain CBS 100304) TaxID=1076935 RepID=U4KY66_PYROM|nr:Protein of unknown function [Pyronema omphalodes CBS 100304]
MPNVFCNLKEKFHHGRKDRENTSNTLDQYEYHSLPSQYRRSTIPNDFRNLKERFRHSRKDLDYRKSNSDTQLRNPIPSNDYNKSSSVTQLSMVDLQPNDNIQPTTGDEMYGYVTPLRYYQRNQKPGEMTEEVNI